jgi:hypothetical protein
MSPNSAGDGKSESFLSEYCGRAVRFEPATLCFGTFSRLSRMVGDEQIKVQETVHAKEQIVINRFCIQCTT